MLPSCRGFFQAKLKPGSSTNPGDFQKICREQGMQMGLTKVPYYYVVRVVRTL